MVTAGGWGEFDLTRPRALWLNGCKQDSTHSLLALPIVSVFTPTNQLAQTYNGPRGVMMTDVYMLYASGLSLPAFDDIWCNSRNHVTSKPIISSGHSFTTQAYVLFWRVDHIIRVDQIQAAVMFDSGEFFPFGMSVWICGTYPGCEYYGLRPIR